MRLTQICVLILALVASLPVYGQKFLQKPYSEWSVEEAKKLITGSAWASEYQSEEGLVAAQQQQQAREANDNNRGSYRGNQGRVDAPVPVTVRLHSALPIRQAMVRLQQIQANYDKMSGEEKQVFDSQMAKFLECAICKDYYVVTLTKWKDTSTSVSDGIFQSMTLAELMGKISLVNDRDEKLELTQFTPPKSAADSALLFFKRTNDEGKPFFTAADKQIRVVFSNELRTNELNAYGKLIPRSFDFKVAKMLSDKGDLVF